MWTDGRRLEQAILIPVEKGEKLKTLNSSDQKGVYVF